MGNEKVSLVNEIASQAIDIINNSGNILKTAISVFRFCYEWLSRKYDMSKYDIYLSSYLFKKYPEDYSSDKIIAYLNHNDKLFQDDDDYLMMSKQKEEIYDAIIWNILDSIANHLKPGLDKADTLKDMTKLVLKAIGYTGSFDREGIFEALLSFTSVYDTSSSRENVDRPIKELIEAKLLEKIDINNPINPKYYIYKLTEKGRSKFRDLFKTEPVKALFDKSLPEIGSIEHFIGVHELSKLLRKSSMKYDEVLTEKAQCKLNLGYRIYCPDIVCKVGDKVVDIFEYETGANTDEFTLDKITKAMSTRNITKKRTVYLNVLTNSQENAYKLKEKADECLKILHSQQQTVRIENNHPVNNIVIQISTVYNIRGAVKHRMSLHDNRVWLWRSDCRNGVKWANGKLPYKQNAQKKNLPNQPDLR